MTEQPDLDTLIRPERASVRIRRTNLHGSDAVAVTHLVRTYLLQTEDEKREHGIAVPSPSGTLPPHYRQEADDPALAYAGCVVLIAELDDQPVGVVVIRPVAGEAEVKRFWTDPSVRGRGVGGALLDAALEVAGSPVRLSVWHWRDAAIRLYESRDFLRVESWEDREALVCMVRHRDTLPLR